MTTKLKIENFGPIKEGEIDLSKRFYLFVGYNNSGKSYVSQLLWAIFQRKTVHEFAETITLEDLNISDDASEIEITEELLHGLLERFATHVKEKVVPDIFNITSSHFTIEKMKLSFQFSIDSIREIEKNISPSIGIKIKGKEKVIKKFVLEKNNNSLTIKLNNENLDEIKADIRKEIFDEILSENDSRISFFITSFIINELILDNKSSPFFLPASRLLYLSFYQYVFRIEKEKRENMSKALLDFLESKKDTGGFSELLSSFKSPYTEPVNFLLNKIYQLNESQPTLHTHDNFVDRLEQLFEGDVVMEKREGIAPIEFIHRINKEDSKKLSMHLASSSINQLATLYLYFKYWVKDDDFLIIDEPEENLHPENQIALLNLLLSFCNQNNNRVLITTHSPLMTEMVSNYYCMASLREEGVDINTLFEAHSDMIIDTDVKLTIDEMGVYFFEGKLIRQYEMREYGVFFEDFIETQKKSTHIKQILAEKIYEIDNR
jgi:AAA15 family ATPase/GTPase